MIFTGPGGTGKTTAAKALAKKLNGYCVELICSVDLAFSGLRVALLQKKCTIYINKLKAI
jgi:MoxR-like ATPase